MTWAVAVVLANTALIAFDELAVEALAARDLPVFRGSQ